MGELYTLMGRVRPPAIAGFLTLAAMLMPPCTASRAT